jgi:hypothetical protein
MPNRIEARSAKAALTNATGRLPLLRLFSTPLTMLEPASHWATWAACKMGGASECAPLRSQSDSKNASK